MGEGEKGKREKEKENVRRLLPPPISRTQKIHTLTLFAQ